MTQSYVLCFAHPWPHAFASDVLLIEKQKPAWQVGKWNLPGGKIEGDESPKDAAIRELWEEAGIRADPKESYVMGRITGPGFVVFVVFCTYGPWFGGRAQTVIPNLTPERVFWKPIKEAMESPQLMPNLRIIIPFVVAGLKDWEIVASDSERIETQWVVRA
jgi:8-oxo-dGTP pyrophosphatase MutT (NUDIX family)